MNEKVAPGPNFLFGISLSYHYNKRPMFPSILLCAATLASGPEKGLRELLNAGNLSHSQIISRCASVITVRFSHDQRIAEVELLESILKAATPGFPIRSSNNYRRGYIEETDIRSSVLHQNAWKRLIDDVAHVEDIWPYRKWPTVNAQRRGYQNVIGRKMASNMRLLLYLKTYKGKEYIAEIEYDSIPRS